eukprot:153463-Prymnesium_polylepis.2
MLRHLRRKVAASVPASRAQQPPTVSPAPERRARLVEVHGQRVAARIARGRTCAGADCHVKPSSALLYIRSGAGGCSSSTKTKTWPVVSSTVTPPGRRGCPARP